MAFRALSLLDSVLDIACVSLPELGVVLTATTLPWRIFDVKEYLLEPYKEV